PAVHILCALTSIAGATLLIRGYFASRVRLLLWSSVCFIGLALNNVMLVLDELVFPNMDLSIPRATPALFGLVALIYGLVWDAE
ncbi:MAG: DUF5985 family protein, partial [Polyangiaceae bacterium]|nr:DUF5985 family protein [Polyangiaceae bacterium]